MLTQEFLKEHFHYNPDSGLFVRLKLTSSASRAKIGDIAGCKYSDGYIYMKINSKHHKAHRLAFLYMHGKMPEHTVDHINGIKDDNRFCNLRKATKSENTQNQRRPHKSNQCGFLGVYFENESGRYVAQLSINGKPKKLGRFDTAELAHEAYLSAKRQHHTTCTI